MTVIVTGVGFLGGYVVRDLVAAREKVVLFGFLGGSGDPGGPLPELGYIDRLIGGGVRDRVEVVVGDAGDLDALTATGERYGAEAIVHFATMLSASAQANPWQATRINVMGTANAFEAAARLRMRKVVWMSSTSIYGPNSLRADGSVDDTSPPDPSFTYGAAKLMGEKLALSYAERFEVDITGIRPSRVYGFGEYVKLGRGGGSAWLNELLYRPAIGDGAVVVPFGRRSVDFLYVEDIADGVVRALAHREPTGADSYLMGGDYRPLAEAVDFVRALLPEADITLSADDLDLPPGSTLGFALRSDSTRATRAFGYRPRFPMEAGVYRTVNGNRLLAGLDPLPEPPRARPLPAAG